jgi:hypothetical protein
VPTNVVVPAHGWPYYERRRWRKNPCSQAPVASAVAAAPGKEAFTVCALAGIGAVFCFVIACIDPFFRL